MKLQRGKRREVELLARAARLEALPFALRMTFQKQLDQLEQCR